MWRGRGKLFGKTILLLRIHKSRAGPAVVVLQSASKAKLVAVIHMHHCTTPGAKIAGRLAAQIAPILRGKHKPTFCPNDDCGDYVVVVNAKAVEFTGGKWKQKLYRWHSGFPGGLKERPASDQLERKPEEILRRAVMGMLPKNSLRKRLASKLLIYAGPTHPHDDRLPAETTQSLLETGDCRVRDNRPPDTRKNQDENYVPWP